MRILLISTTFFPEENARAYRWMRIASALVKWGHEVWVISRRRPDCPDYLEQEGVRIIRPRFRFNKIHGGIGRKNNAFHQVYKKKQPKRYTWLDSSLFWWPAGVLKAKELILAKEIERVYSIGLPFTSHLIGLAVRWRFPALPWFADYGDPFTPVALIFGVRGSLFGRFKKWTEQFIVKRADWNFVNTSSLKSYFQKLGGSNTRVVEVSHVLPTSGRFVFKKKEINADGVMHLGYFGTLYPDLRSPASFLSFLEDFFTRYPEWKEKIKLHFYGQVHPASIPGVELPLFAEYHGFYPHHQIGERMEAMDVLFSLGNTNPFMIPMKLPEYLISGKPVLHVAQHPEDPTAQLVAGCPTFLCLYPPEVAQETDPFALFKSFLENLPHIGLDTAALEALHSRFSPEAVAHRYLHPSFY